MLDQLTYLNEDCVRRYDWADPSPVARMEVLYVGRGQLRCRLWANTSEKSRVIEQLPARLYEKGYKHAYPDVQNNENIFVIDRVPDLDRLLSQLTALGAIKGAPQIDILAPMPHEREGVFNRALSSIKGDTLKWSGRVGLAGHAAILATGLIKKDVNLAWGATGALNPIILSVYGNGKSEIDFQDMMHKMTEYFRAEGIDLPQDDYVLSNSGFFAGMNRLLATYPVHIGHTVGSFGAYNNMKSGINAVRAGNNAAFNRIAAGATSLIGNGAVVLIPETKKDPDEEQTSTFEQLKYGATHVPDGLRFALNHPTQVPGKFYHFIKDSPLRFNAMLNLSDNIFWFFDARGQMKYFARHGSPFEGTRGKLDKTTPYLMMVTAISFTASTALAMISSKNRGADQMTPEMYEPIYAAAAKFLVQMPEEDRTDTLARMAVFLAEQEAVQDAKITAADIVREVSEKIDVMKSSPWINRLNDNDNKQKEPQRGAAVA